MFLKLKRQDGQLLIVNVAKIITIEPDTEGMSRLTTCLGGRYGVEEKFDELAAALLPNLGDCAFCHERATVVTPTCERHEPK